MSLPETETPDVHAHAEAMPENTPDTAPEPNVVEPILVDAPELVQDDAPSAEDELRKWKDSAMRASADIANMKRNHATELQRARESERRRLLTPWLDVVDTLERALEQAGEADNAWAQGMKQVQQQMLSALTGFGVAPYGVPGEAFDPQRHDALSMAPHPSFAPDTLHTVVQKGYTQGESIIRTAKVLVVSETTPPAEA